MKPKLFCIVGLFLSISALAEQVAPEIIVKGSIESVQRNDLNGVIATVNLIEVAKQQKHPHAPEAFVELLKDIDVEKIKLEEAVYTMGEEIITIRMIAPRSLDFKLLKEKTEGGKPAFRYRVASVSPRPEDSMTNGDKQTCQICGAGLLSNNISDIDADTLDSRDKLFHHYGIHGHEGMYLVFIESVKQTGRPKNELLIESVVEKAIMGQQKKDDKLIFNRLVEGDATLVSQRIKEMMGGRYYVFLRQSDIGLAVDSQDPIAVWKYSAELEKVSSEHETKCLQ